MKIPSHTSAGPVSPINNRPKPSDSPVTPNETRSTTANASALRADTISSLFARAGVDGRSTSTDYKQRRQALTRRDEVNQLSKLDNLQAVMDIAMAVNVRHTTDDEIDPDWFFAFVSLAENVYSTAMQELWGKILAVEVASPGSFSLRSLQTITYLTQRDAVLFGRAAGMAMRSQDTVPRLVVGYHQRRSFFQWLKNPAGAQLNLAHYGLSYPDLLTLIDLKLIFASEIESAEISPDKPITWRYGQQGITLQARKPGVALVYYKFTHVGAELFKLIARQDSPDYIEALSHVLHPVFEMKRT